MARTVQEPTITERAGPGSRECMVYNHPAYAQMSANRVEGGAVLYGSDFTHQRYIRLRIQPSELHRHLANDWCHTAGRPIVEVDMSEAQWATFVSSMNVGQGVQCTLSYRDGVPVPGIPNPIDRTEQFGAEVKQRLQRGMDHLRDLEEAIAATGLSQKKQAELLNRVHAARQDMGENVVYVADQFSEHMEQTTERAKTEINAYFVGTVQRAGLQALGAPVEPILELADRRRHDESAA